MSNYRRIFMDGYSYYITVVTQDRNPILVENIELLRESFTYAKSKFSFSIEDITILPDHFHMIISVSSATEYPKIISTIKRYFSQNCDSIYTKHIWQSSSRHKQRYKPIWQKRFYEHTIRDERDYRQKQQYIYSNPVKHGYVDDIEVWEYSSYTRRFGRAKR